MSGLHVRQLKSKLEQDFESLIDMTDYESRPKERHSAFLTRALSAFALTSQLGRTISPDCIVDGFEDNGIDALYCDVSKSELWLVQSKWIEAGKGGPALGDIGKFVDGVNDVIECNFERFNNRFRKWDQPILQILDNTAVTIHVLIVYTGDQFSSHAQRKISDLLKKQNDVSDLIRFEEINLKALYGRLVSAVRGQSIDAEIALCEYGVLEEPVTAYYGYVWVSDLHRLWQKHKTMLFAENLRDFLGSTEVNEAIQSTLKNEPEKFFYLNNGITISAKTIARKAIGGSDRKTGTFVCSSISVINGAQTVGCIGALEKTAAEKLDKARVLCRLIEYGTTEQNFAQQLTRACNTQNEILAKDFIAQDEIQLRLSMDFALAGKRYAFRSTEPDSLPVGEDGCTIDEATVALACLNHSVDLTVIAKTKVSRLWTDPVIYRQIFKQQQSVETVWQAVKILRAGDEAIKSLVTKADRNLRPIVVHGNRFILHLIFQKLRSNRSMDSLSSVEPQEMNTLAADLAAAVQKIVESEYPDAPKYSLFKNHTKTRAIAETILKTRFAEPESNKSYFQLALPFEPCPQAFEPVED